MKKKFRQTPAKAQTPTPAAEDPNRLPFEQTVADDLRGKLDALNRSKMDLANATLLAHVWAAKAAAAIEAVKAAEVALSQAANEASRSVGVDPGATDARWTAQVDEGVLVRTS